MCYNIDNNSDVVNAHTNDDHDDDDEDDDDNIDKKQKVIYIIFVALFLYHIKQWMIIFSWLEIYNNIVRTTPIRNYL